MKDDIPSPEQPWREDADGVLLIGRRCTGCGKRLFPAAEICDACDGEVFEPVELERHGTLYSFSEIHVAPKAFETPYVVGYVDFGSDLRVFGQIAAPAAALEVGCRVRPVIGPIRRRADGTIVQGYRFEMERERDA